MATTESTKETKDDKKTDGQNLPVSTDMQDKNDRADAIIRRYALFGTATGLIPSFGLDVAVLTAVQVKMIKDLADVYEYDVDDQMIRMTITTGVTSLAGRLVTAVASTITSAFTPLKFLVGGATQAALSGFLTAQTGNIYKERLSSGQNPADVTVSEIVNEVISQVQQGNWNPTRLGGLKSSFNYLLKDSKN